MVLLLVHDSFSQTLVLTMALPNNLLSLETPLKTFSIIHTQQGEYACTVIVGVGVHFPMIVIVHWWMSLHGTIWTLCLWWLLAMMVCA